MNEVYEYLKSKIDIFKNNNLVVATSGGPDSMLLLYLLNKIRVNNEFNIVCAHVNHNVRKESADEQIFLKEYCEKNNIIFECMKIEKYTDDNFHNQARIIRYNFFENIMKKYNSKFLFTAHHGDDLIETILMRITRGSTLKGYSGFQKESNVNNKIYFKPLISVTKKQILEFNQENNIPFVTDASNEKEYYTRNRYRKHVLPFLKNEEENVHKKYLQFSEEILKYENYLEEETNKYFSKVFVDNQIIIDKFVLLNNLIQERIIIKILDNIYNDNINLIQKSNVNLILELINSNKANMKLDLPKNIIAIKNYNNLEFLIDNKITKDYNFKLDKKIELETGTIEIVEKSDDTSNYCIRLNSNEIVLPLFIRNKKDSDRIEIKGLNGSKKIKDIYINSKIPIQNRKKLPILVDSNGIILWLPGLKKSKYDKAKDEKYDIIVKYY